MKTNLTAPALALTLAFLVGCATSHRVEPWQVAALGRGETVDVGGGSVALEDVRSVRIHAARPNAFVQSDEDTVELVRTGERVGGTDTATVPRPMAVDVGSDVLRVVGRKRTVIADPQDVAGVEVSVATNASGIGMVSAGVPLLVAGLVGGSALAYAASNTSGPLFCVWTCTDDNSAQVAMGMLSALAFAAGLGPGIPLIAIGARRIERTTQVSVGANGLSARTSF